MRTGATRIFAKRTQIVARQIGRAFLALRGVVAAVTTASIIATDWITTGFVCFHVFFAKKPLTRLYVCCTYIVQTGVYGL